MANAIRAGIGPWTAIDDDLVLPHNLVRQAQLDTMVGHSKALSSAGLLNALIGEPGNTGINANFLSPRDGSGEVGEALTGARLAIDFSASPAVLGALADDGRIARAASFFFNPDARDLVILNEDKERSLRLDEIEAQYFMAAATSPLLHDHLDGARVDFVRYANACQDLTRPVPPWRVQTLCGVAAGRLERLLNQDGACADIWSLHPETASIVAMRLPLSAVHRREFARFRVTVSADVVERMKALRLRDAPDETGGILLGSFDLQRKVIHVVDALQAPPDSRQSPTYFVRGTKHLKPIVDGIGGRSAGAITYLGEWHSHPDEAKVGPSEDDENVFAYLKANLHVSEAPYVMMICGKTKVWLRAGWSCGDPGEGLIVE
jgi:integrative and conjugative element protein (TIGR02256 family)